MSSSATGVGMPICFLGAILLILTQKSSQKFGDVLGIMIAPSVLLATGLLRKGDKLICIHALFHFFSTFLRKLLLVSKENRNFAATIETLITLGL